MRMHRDDVVDAVDRRFAAVCALLNPRRLQDSALLGENDSVRKSSATATMKRRSGTPVAAFPRRQQSSVKLLLVLVVAVQFPRPVLSFRPTPTLPAAVDKGGRTRRKGTTGKVILASGGNEPIFYNDFEDSSSSWPPASDGGVFASTTMDPQQVLTLDIDDSIETRDWRDVRRNLIAGKKRSMVSKPNAALLKKQNEKLALEETWAHDISMVRP
jgi:hypothetical protein